MMERKTKMTNYDKYLADQMINDDFRKKYEALEPEFAVILALIDARTAEGNIQGED